MVLKFALVARGSSILCEYDATNPWADGGDAHAAGGGGSGFPANRNPRHELHAGPRDGELAELCRDAVHRIPKGNTGSSRNQYSFMGYVFHYVGHSVRDSHGRVTEHYTFLCVGSPQATTEVCFEFLSELKRQFLAKQQRRRAGVYGSSMQENTLLLMQLMKEYNNLTTGDSSAAQKLQKMERELGEVTEIMKDSIDSVMERGEKLGSLVDKTSVLKSDAFSYRKKSYEKVQEQWREKMRGRALFAGVCVLSVYGIMVSSGCGITLRECGIGGFTVTGLFPRGLPGLG